VLEVRVAQDLVNITKILRGLRKVPNCPKKIDVPCIFCLECPLSNYDEKLYEDGLLKITTNSAILNLKVEVGESELDKALLVELVKALSSRISSVLENPEEGYQISFFIYYTDKDAVADVERFMNEVLPQLRGIITQGRINVRNWARSMINKLFPKL